MGLCKEYRPLTREELAEATGLTLEQVTDFFDRNFGGYDNYVRLCEGKHGLDFVLAMETEPH